MYNVSYITYEYILIILFIYYEHVKDMLRTFEAGNDLKLRTSLPKKISLVLIKRKECYKHYRLYKLVRPEKYGAPGRAPKALVLIFFVIQCRVVALVMR